MIRRKCESSSIPNSAKPRWGGVETRPPWGQILTRGRGVGKMRWGVQPPNPPAIRTLAIGQLSIYYMRVADIASNKLRVISHMSQSHSQPHRNTESKAYVTNHVVQTSFSGKSLV